VRSDNTFSSVASNGKEKMKPDVYKKPRIIDQPHSQGKVLSYEASLIAVALFRFDPYL